MPRIFFFVLSIILLQLSVPFGLAQAEIWEAGLKLPDSDKAIEFLLEIETGQTQDRIGRSTPRVFVRNGTEKIEVPSVDFRLGYTRFSFSHYDSVITTQISRAEFIGGISESTEMRGEFKKRRGDDEWVKMEFSAKRRKRETPLENPEAFLGKWKVKFDSSEEPAVGVFKKDAKSNRVLGTFLTTTGDYRYLAGYVKESTLTLCCFDGAHAFRFEAKKNGQNELAGQFWSSNTWYEKWTAKRSNDAKLPDAFKQTMVQNVDDLGSLAFPDLNGTMRNLDDIGFQSKARIIYVFGSWCPNCHDAAAYFKELQQKYGDRGFSILGLAFELTSDHRRNAQQVKTYLRTHGVTYPVLIAGPADKAKASKRLPILDRIRSYPTTIFLDSKGKVHGVHTGFTGPATGKAYEDLKQKFESLIESMLAQE